MKKLRIAFDIIDENGEKLPLNYHNTVTIEMTKDEIETRDVFCIARTIETFLSSVKYKGLTAHLFGIDPDVVQAELQGKIPCKESLQGLQYVCSRMLLSDIPKDPEN